MKISICRSILVAFAFIGALANSATAKEERKADHVIVIGVDGLSPDGIMHASAPNLKYLMQNGSYSLTVRGVLPTSSSANWASILTGAGPEQHGVTSNDWRVNQFNIPTSVIGSGGFYPSIFQVLSDQRPEWKVGSIYHWDGFANLYDRRFVDYDVHGRTGDDTATLAVNYLKAEKPEFLFVHLDDTDYAGHAFGHGSQQYYAAVADVDRLIGLIRQATVEAGIADETVILVTSDHGGVGKGHGGESLAEIEVPWILYGKGVNQGVRLNLPINNFDTAATVAWLLGLDVPYAWIGRPVKAAFTGEKVPTQAYLASALYASPVIEPAASGNSPAGGLFVGKSALMTIRNANSLGEIRYTLDGSTPTLTSARYTKPVKLTQSTVVRATLFVDGQAASVTSSGYFRVLKTDTAKARGVSYNVYLLPERSVRLPDFSQLKPTSSGITHEVSLDGLELPRNDNVGVVFEGYLEIAKAGEYSFSLASDDGSKLYINGTAVVDNDGDHGVISASGSVMLQPGKHILRVEYFNGGGGAWLGAYFEGPGILRQFIDPNMLTAK